MEIRPELLVAGVAVGCIYAVLAVGFVIVYKATRTFNLAQGGLILIGTYFAYSLASAGIPPVIAVILSLVVGVLLGFAIEAVFLRPMIGESSASVLLLTLGINEIIKGILGVIFGSNQRPFPGLFPKGSLAVGGGEIPLIYLWEIGISLAFFLAFSIFYTRSPIGLSMRAASNNQDWSSLIGIDVSRVTALSWGFAALVGAVGGAFLAELLSVNSSLEAYAFRAFPAAILGGIDSVGGALLGGLMIGIIESLVGGYLDPLLGGGGKEVMAYVVLLGTLLIRPYGFFGTEEIERL